MNSLYRRTAISHLDQAHQARLRGDKYNCRRHLAVAQRFNIRAKLDTWIIP